MAITPPAMSPATYRSPIVTPWPALWLLKIAPSRTSMTAGRAKMNTTAWRSRKNAFSSTRPRDSPTRHTPGSRGAAARATMDAAAVDVAVTAGLR